MHSAIESAKKNKTIYSPEQYYFLICAARPQNSYSVTEMVTDDFIDFEAMSKSRKLNWKMSEEKKRVNWRNIRFECSSTFGGTFEKLLRKINALLYSKTEHENYLLLDCIIDIKNNYSIIVLT